MVAIFSGTSITVLLAIQLTRKHAFDAAGNLCEAIYK